MGGEGVLGHRMHLVGETEGFYWIFRGLARKKTWGGEFANLYVSAAVWRRIGSQSREGRKGPQRTAKGGIDGSGMTTLLMRD